MKKIIGFVLGIGFSSVLMAQGPFAPSADSVGTTAIHKDSSIVAAWISNCNVTRGPQHLPNSNSPLANIGSESSALGYPDGDVLSLGDGGSAIVEFLVPLSNHGGFDFAIFENGIIDQSNGKAFLELAFVEVSSDGTNFYRFPNQSLTQTDTQTNPFGYTTASDIYNLAGKYSAGYGTPFDLAELDTVVGLDINAITHIKIIDVVGSIDSSYASYDSYGRIINDPFPTSFESGGFDLDAVAWVDLSYITSVSNAEANAVSVYPNPAQNFIRIHSNSSNGNVMVRDVQGRVVLETENIQSELNITFLPKGMYIVEVVTESNHSIHKIMKQ